MWRMMRVSRRDFHANVLQTEAVGQVLRKEQEKKLIVGALLGHVIGFTRLIIGGSENSARNVQASNFSLLLLLTDFQD